MPDRSSERRAGMREAPVLRAVFLTGAITDAVAPADAPALVAPAYTPLLWLTGLGLIGRRLYVPSPYRRWMYVALACGFVAVHVMHTTIVYARNLQTAWRTS